MNKEFEEFRSTLFINKEIQKIDITDSQQNLFLISIYLKGKFENPFEVIITVKVEKNKRLFTPIYSHWFKNSISPTFYKFNPEIFDALIFVAHEITTRALINYRSSDLNCSWEENERFKKSKMRLFKKE